MKKIKSKWENLDKGVQKWATRLGAIATIIGVLTAGSGILISQVDNAIAMRLDVHTTEIQGEVKRLASKVDEQDRQTDLQLTRLELLTLLDNNPYNLVEIEKVARHYFQDLGGDWYMSDLYSKWASTYGGNAEIMVK